MGDIDHVVSMRPPPIGWLLLLFGVVCVLLAVGSGLAWHRADRVRGVYLARIDTVGVLLDSLNAIRCVPIVPGEDVRVYPAPRPDSLKRAAR